MGRSQKQKVWLHLILDINNGRMWILYEHESDKKSILGVQAKSENNQKEGIFTCNDFQIEWKVHLRYCWELKSNFIIEFCP